MLCHLQSKFLAFWQAGKVERTVSGLEVRSFESSLGFFIRALQTSRVSVFLSVTPDLIVHGLTKQ